MQQEYHFPFTQLETRCWGKKGSCRVERRENWSQVREATKSALLVGVALGREKRSQPQPSRPSNATARFSARLFFLTMPRVWPLPCPRFKSRYAVVKLRKRRGNHSSASSPHTSHALLRCVASHLTCVCLQDGQGTRCRELHL